MRRSLWPFAACIALVWLALGCGGASDAPRGDAETREARDAETSEDADASGGTTGDGACETSPPLRAPMALFGEHLAEHAPLARDCNHFAVPTREYRVVVPAMQELHVSTSAAFIPRVLESCGSFRCTAGDAPWTRTDIPAYTNATDADVTVVVAVSPSYAWGAAESYALTLTLAPVSPTVLCARAPTAHDGDSVWNFTSSARNPVPGIDRAAPTPPAHFYRIEVPAGRRLVVSPTRGADAWVLLDCAPEHFVGARWLDPVELSTATAWHNADLTPRTVVVALAPHGDGARVETVGARFELGASVPAATCATSPQITGDTTVRDLSTRDGGESLRACLFDGRAVAASALWWRVRIPAGHRVTATATRQSEATAAGLGVAFLAACGATTCLASNLGTATPGARADWANATSEPQDVVLVAAGDAPRFDLAVTFTRFDPAGVCATAPPLSPGVPITRQRFDAAGLDSTLCGDYGPAPTLYYRVAVPTDHEIHVSVTAADVSVRVALLDRCDTPQCLSTYFGTSTAPLQWAHQDGGTRDVWVAVSRVGRTRGYDGTFDLLATLAPTPASAHCATPMELASGVAVTVAGGYAHDLATDCLGGRVPSLFHRVTVPPGQRLRVTAVTGGAAANVRLLDACHATRCLDGGPHGSAATWTNPGATPRSVLVVTGLESGPQDITLTATTAPSPDDARCETAPRVTLPASVHIEGLGDARDADPACGTARPSSYHALRVPAHHRLSVTKSSYGSATWLSLREACGGACLSTSRDARASMSWSNLGDEDRDVVLALESDFASDAVDLMLSATRIEPDGACATAPTIASGESRALNWSHAVEAAPGCGGSSPSWSPSLYHAVDVPPGQTVTATITSSALYRVGVRILAGCGAPTCLSYWSSGLDASSVTTSWRNAGDSAQRVYIASSNAAYESASATLQVTLAP